MKRKRKTERRAHPEQTSWTRDLFWIVLEGTIQHKKIAQRSQPERVNP